MANTTTPKTTTPKLPNTPAYTVPQLVQNLATLPGKQVYPSAQAMFRAAGAHCNASGKVACGSQARQVLRSLTPAMAAQVFGSGVATGYVASRGGTSITPAHFLLAYKLHSAVTAQARQAALLAARAQAGRKVQAGQAS